MRGKAAFDQGVMCVFILLRDFPGLIGIQYIFTDPEGQHASPDEVCLLTVILYYGLFIAS